MNTLSEATSRLTVSKELTKEHIPVRHRVLKYMQEHPEICQKTNFKEMSTRMFFPNLGITPKMIQSSLINMCHHNMIGYRGTAQARRKDIFINYLHSNIPKDILDSAPDISVEKAKKVIEENEIKQKAKEIEKQNQVASQSNPTVEIPLNANDLTNGFSLTLNINFTIQK